MSPELFLIFSNSKLLQGQFLRIAYYRFSICTVRSKHIFLWFNALHCRLSFDPAQKVSHHVQPQPNTSYAVDHNSNIFFSEFFAQAIVFLWCVLFVISISWRFVPQLHIISSSGRGKRCIRHMHSRHVRSTLRILPYRRGWQYLWIDSFCIRGYVYASRFGCSPCFVSVVCISWTINLNVSLNCRIFHFVDFVHENYKNVFIVFVFCFCFFFCLSLCCFENLLREG